MNIQQHDSVVVDAGVTAAGLRRSTARGRGVAGEREAPGLWCGCPPFPPTIYRAKGEGGRSLGPSSKEGCGQGGVHPPQGT